MESKNISVSNLPKHLAPLEYESKAHKKELPPVLVLAEKQPDHCPKLRIWAVGKESENENLIDKFDESMNDMSTVEKSLFKQEPKLLEGVSWTSGWEFYGKKSMDEEQELFLKVKKLATEMNMPLYYQGADNNLHLIPDELQDSKGLSKLVENNHQVE